MKCDDSIIKRFVRVRKAVSQRRQRRLKKKRVARIVRREEE